MAIYRPIHIILDGKDLREYNIEYRGFREVDDPTHSHEIEAMIRGYEFVLKQDKIETDFLFKKSLTELHCDFEGINVFFRTTLKRTGNFEYTVVEKGLFNE